MPQTVTSRPRTDRVAARERIVAATIELVRERSFAELTVGEIMSRAGLERTIFYRHFENVGELLLGAGREAIDRLYDGQVRLAASRDEFTPPAIEQALAIPVEIYSEHGPLLRAVSEAVAADQLTAVDQEMLRRQFDELVVAALAATGAGVADPAETARALNLLNEAYLLDAFGREPRVEPETAVRTLAAIWSAVLTQERVSGSKP